MYNNTTWQPSATLGLLACCLVFCASSTATAEDAMPAARRVLPVDGRSWEARLLAITAAGRITMERHGKRAEFAWEDLVEWGSPFEPRRGAVVITTGGSWLVGEVKEVQDDQLTLHCRSAGRLVVPMTHVRGLLLTLPVDPAARDRLVARIESDTRDSDQVALVNGDLLRGTLVDLDERLLRFETASGTLSIRRDRIVAFLADPALLLTPSDRNTARTSAGLRDGSVWRIGPRAADTDAGRRAARLASPAVCRGGSNEAAQRRTLGKTGLEVTDGRLRARLTDGLVVPDLPADEFVFLQPAVPRLLYLSDLAPEATFSRPSLQLRWPLGEDRAAHGGRLRAGGRLYLKGLGMHSAASVTYPLDGPFDRFDTEVAIDDRAGRRGSAIFRIALLRSGRWQEVVESDVVRGGQPPLSLSVDLTHATAIRLQVDVADHGDEGDFADWLLARLVRSRRPTP
ncbi:MAG: NPCBM/NEW2 domain-containing protein [Pirellulales bacterium]